MVWIFIDTLAEKSGELSSHENPMKRLAFILSLFLLLAAGPMFSQEVAWSLFSSGFSRYQAPSFALLSSVGETFVGFSRTDSTSVRSGSLSPNVLFITDVESGVEGLPGTFVLYQNYPNPFNPSTTIRYDLPKASFVTLRIYDIRGQQILTVVDEDRPAGIHLANVSLSNLSSGIYFYRIHAGEYVTTRKFVLLK